MCGMKAPSSFAVTQLIVAIMSSLNILRAEGLELFPMNSHDAIPYTSIDYYHKLIEAQKFAFSLRNNLGDPRFISNANELVENMTSTAFVEEIVHKIRDTSYSSASDYLLADKEGEMAQPNDQGTSHISVIDSDGNAVALTSSINNGFGAMVRSEQLGIIWNNQMDDFSIPGVKNFFGFEPAPNNFIVGGKRPMSSMSPLIIYDESTKTVKMSIGASGGSKIISTLAQIILQSLSFGRTLKESIDMPRLHNQLAPFITFYEQGFSTINRPIFQSILNGLRERGQNLTEMLPTFSNVHAIIRDQNGTLFANSDHRRPVYTYPTGY